MTDLEMTRLCAEALGYRTQIAVDMATKNGDEYLLVWSDGEVRDSWNPLTDDAQAMALVKKLGMHIHNDGETWWAVDGSGEYDSSDYTDLNRAICECCAKMMLTKKESAHDAQAKGKDR